MKFYQNTSNEKIRYHSEWLGKPTLAMLMLWKAILLKNLKFIIRFVQYFTMYKHLKLVI